MRPSLGRGKQSMWFRGALPRGCGERFFFLVSESCGWLDVFLREGPPGQGAILLDVLCLILRLVIEIKFSLYFLFFKAAFQQILRAVAGSTCLFFSVLQDGSIKCPGDCSLHHLQCAVCGLCGAALVGEEDQRSGAEDG